ncbi:MAG: DNA-binding protein [Gammaproteobacteria bacterium]|nr:MAG: DNA-binding protein [Gammaproteobacteria bacterium]
MIEHINDLGADWVSPPGATITDLLEERGWTQRDLVKRVRSSEKHISQLISGQVSLSEEMAVKLAAVLGSTPAFWITRESQYRATIVQREYKEKLASWVGWLDELPVRELMKLKCIEKRRLTEKAKPEVVDMVLKFFRCSSPDAWANLYGKQQAAFRITNQAQGKHRSAITAWLRAGEDQIESRGIEMPNYDRIVFLDALKEIRSLTVLDVEEFEPLLKEYLASAGVSLAFVPAFKGTKVSGAARWLSRSQPLIQLSLFGKWSDRFWFTFFHEAAHILYKHDTKMVFLDDGPGGNSDRQEVQANNWAADMLIPKEYAKQLNKVCKSDNAIKGFAKKINIHPGIVVGRMQHERLIPPSHFNHLKARYEIKLEN